MFESVHMATVYVGLCTWLQCVHVWARDYSVCGYVHVATVCVVCARGYSVHRVQQGRSVRASGAGVTGGCEFLVCVFGSSGLAVSAPAQRHALGKF